MSNIVETVSEAQETKDHLEGLGFNEQINMIRKLRQSWNFESDYEENTENFTFIADDNSKLHISIDDAAKTISCEV